VKLINWQLLIQTVVLVLIFPASGRADDEDTPAYYRKHGLQAKIDYCTDCHGASGRGYNGFVPIPRIAGQTSVYINNQLHAFSEHKRDNPRLKISVVHSGLSSSLKTALAAHFAKLNPMTVGGAPKQYSATGKKIYEEGLPQLNVPACAACHGADAKGSGPNPRLAGQLYSYTVEQLNRWIKGSRGLDPVASNAPNLMAHVAGTLTRQQIMDVAAYLTSIK
jgi:cytochrome c553